MRRSFSLRANESWWGGASHAGTEMPFRDGYSLDLRGENFGNQASPLLVSNTGRYVWSEAPFRFQFGKGKLFLEGNGPFHIDSSQKTLKSAYRSASRQFFPAQGTIPEPLLFTAPQYNTWIELKYQQEQNAILQYAKAILHHGFGPGVLMIDEGWANYYGDWDFNPTRFLNPKKLIDQLHQLGFKVMLWIVPFVVPDSGVFRQVRSGNILVKGPDGKPVIREWWNGYSAVVDVTGGEGYSWFSAQLKRLQKNYGIDGFKFDAGDTPQYRDNDKLSVSTHANGHTEAFGRVGLKYPLNEYRACWKCAGQPLVQRLRDKNHTWDLFGLKSLIPNTLAQGLMGYAFVCPDMIGGGDYSDFLEDSPKLDPELFVRYAQASALMPMMQFSAAPWRVLDKKHQRLCLEATKLHSAFGETILALAKKSAQNGEPIVRHMAYEFPGCGYEGVDDQFLLGPNILVAPVLNKGAKKREVKIPPGTWKGEDGSEYTGPKRVEVKAPLERLPHFLSLHSREII